MKQFIIFVAKALFSGLAIILLFLDIYCEDVHATYVTVLLLLVAVIPWLTNLKSLEIFNLGKVEWFSQKKQEEIEQIAEELPQTSSNKHDKESGSDSETISLIYEDNIPLTLAYRRMQLESKLRELCRISNIEIDKEGISQMANILCRREIIDSNQYKLIRDLLPIMNAAVHGRLSSEQVYHTSWVLDVANKLNNSIDFKIKKYSDR